MLIGIIVGALASFAWLVWSQDQVQSRLMRVRHNHNGQGIQPTTRAWPGNGFLQRWFPSVFGPKHPTETTGEEAIAIIDRAVQLLKVGVVPARVMSLLAADQGQRFSAVLARIARVMELGQPPHQAIRHHVRELEPREREIFNGMAAVWMVAETSGAPAAEMLQRYAQSCRDAADSQRERDIALAGPQSTVTVLSFLPLISMVLAVLIGANYAELLSEPVGFMSVASGAVLLVLGRLWMRVMLHRAA